MNTLCFGPRPFALGLLLLVLLATGCAPPPNSAERQRFLWPPMAERPRIEYIGFYHSDADVLGPGHWLMEAAFGREKAVPLFKHPGRILADDRGRVLVADVRAGKVVVLDLQGRRVRSLRSQGGEDHSFRFPAGMAIDGEGRIYVADAIEQRILRFGADERLQTHLGAGQLSRPGGMAIDPHRQRLYVVDTDAHRLTVFDLEGRLLHHVGERGTAPGQFNFPLEIDLDAEGNLYVLDAMNARVQVFDPQGVFLRAFGERGTAAGSFQIPKGLSVSPSGHLYVTDSMANRVVIFDLEGNFLLNFGGRGLISKEGVSPGAMTLPSGIHVDANDTIWVADSHNGIVHRFQYLNDDYLARDPILPGQTYLPPDFFRGGTNQDH